MSFSFVPPETVKIPELNFEENIELISNETAVVVVDMQNDFVKESGSLHVPAAIETVENISELINRARKQNVKIVYTRDTHYDGDKEWEIWPVHCKKGTVGWQIIDELKPAQNDLVIEKNRYDGFYGTPLEHYLSHVWGIKNLVITGTVANICVAHTAGSAGLRWYNLVVPADGISALTEFDQAMALRQTSFLYAGKIFKNCKNIEFRNI